MSTGRLTDYVVVVQIVAIGVAIFVAVWYFLFKRAAGRSSNGVVREAPKSVEDAIGKMIDEVSARVSDTCAKVVRDRVTADIQTGYEAGAYAREAVFKESELKNEIESLLGSGRFDDAEAICLKRLNETTGEVDRVPILRQLHSIAIRQDNKGGAARYIEEAIRCNPCDPVTHYTAYAFYKFVAGRQHIGMAHCKMAADLTKHTKPVYTHELGYLYWESYQAGGQVDSDLLNTAIALATEAMNHVAEAPEPTKTLIPNNLAYYLAQKGGRANLEQALDIAKHLRVDNDFCQDTIAFVKMRAAEAHIDIDVREQTDALRLLLESIKTKKTSLRQAHLEDAMRIFRVPDRLESTDSREKGEA